MRREEWDGHWYPTYEIIRSGRRGTKELRIPLPVDDWLPRAELWVIALDLMNRILEL
jgi:hypothetical protein